MIPPHIYARSKRGAVKQNIADGAVTVSRSKKAERMTELVEEWAKECERCHCTDEVPGECAGQCQSNPDWEGDRA